MDQMPAKICSPLVDGSRGEHFIQSLEELRLAYNQIVELADLGGLPIEVPLQIRCELSQIGDRVFVVIRLAIAELRRSLRALGQLGLDGEDGVGRAGGSI